MNPILNQIHKGMKVYDTEDKEIGTVEFVKFGDEDPMQPGVETATPSAQPYVSPLAEAIHDLFDPTELPEELRDRMLRYGFVRIDVHGLFNADRYIMADQIQSVTNDRVILKTTADELSRPV